MQSDDPNNGNGGDEQPNPTSTEPADKPANSVAADGAKPASSNSSERKQEANRQNAKRSTGPTTERGKRTVRLNPLTHGFYATDAVLGQADGLEDSNEFLDLLEAHKRDWNPQGVTEESLVHTITVLEWRLRRAMVSEVGEIQRGTFSAIRKQFFDQAEALGTLDGSGLPTPTLKEGVLRKAGLVEAQLSLLSTIRMEVKQKGHISEVSQKLLDTNFGTGIFSLATLCYRLSRAAQRRQSSEQGESPEREKLLNILDPSQDVEDSPEQCKQLIIESIDAEISRLREFHMQLENLEKQETDSTLLANRLPAREFVDALTRYETSLDRRKERTLKMLLDLQARRKSGRK